MCVTFSLHSLFMAFLENLVATSPDRMLREVLGVFTHTNTAGNCQHPFPLHIRSVPVHYSFIIVYLQHLAPA